MAMPNKANSKRNKTTINILITAGIAVLSAIGVFLADGGKESGSSPGTGNDIVITKSEITGQAKFFPTKAGGINLEVLAVRASDGTIRTAFNTCQVCNGSPMAYYKQEGDVLVCQNCKNRFSADMVEKRKGGCNPVPIMKEDKTEDDSTITIPGDFIAKNKDLFTENWKTQ